MSDEKVIITLTKKLLIKGVIEAKTGLHIGGTNSAMSIGGVDNAIIRNPLNDEPYIPGSSLKGKMRSLMELNLGEVGSSGIGVKNGPSDLRTTESARLFGNANKHSQRPSRIIVRDCALRGNKKEKEKTFKNTDLPFTEIKTEVVIDRITSKAMPRQLERVPAGAKFELYLVLNVFSEDNEDQLVKNLFFGLQLVQDDYLGGSGSRGSGQVKFEIEEVIERSSDFYKGDEGEKNVTEKYSTKFKNLFA